MKCAIYARSVTHGPQSVAKQIQAPRQKAQEDGLESLRDLVFKGHALSGSEVFGVPSRAYILGRLMGKVLMDMPEGVLLQSNVALDALAPIFEGIVGPVSTRDEMRQKLRGLRIAGCLFRAFATPETHQGELKERARVLIQRKSPNVHSENHLANPLARNGRSRHE